MKEVPVQDDQEGLAAKRYAVGENDRKPYLDRARAASALTIPHLVPPEDFDKSRTLPTPYNGDGAEGVKNLAAKLLLVLLNDPFFRYTVDDFTLDQLTDSEEGRAEVEAALASAERAIYQDIEASGIRAPLYEALRHLIVSGNILVFFPPEGGMRVYHLSQFVVFRDHSGSPYEIILKELLSPRLLPDEVQEALRKGDAKLDDPDAKDVAVFTHIRWVPKAKRWRVHQEVKGIMIEGTRGQYTADTVPWRPLGLIKVSGEHYARGFVEEHLGDLQSSEDLQKAIVIGSAAAAKVLFMVNPNGTTDSETLAEAESGDIVDGADGDVSVLQMNKHADFSVAAQTASKVSDRLSRAFLMNSSVQRNAERVTATEWNLMVAELEEALGGVYSILAEDLQKPIVEITAWRMTKSGRLPKLPKELTRPTIITGVEALRRGKDLQALQGFADDLVKVGQVKPSALEIIDDNELIKRIGAARGIDTKGLIKSKTTIANEQSLKNQDLVNADQNQQVMDVVKAVGPEVVKQMGPQP